MKTIHVIVALFALAIMNTEIKATTTTNFSVLTISSRTIVVHGGGGYDVNTNVICPFVDNGGSGTWGPLAAIEMWDGVTLEGIIEEPAEGPDGEVANFNFSSLREL